MYQKPFFTISSEYTKIKPSTNILTQNELQLQNITLQITTIPFQKSAKMWASAITHIFRSFLKKWRDTHRFSIANYSRSSINRQALVLEVKISDYYVWILFQQYKKSKHKTNTKMSWNQKTCLYINTSHNFWSALWQQILICGRKPQFLGMCVCDKR